MVTILLQWEKQTVNLYAGGFHGILPVEGPVEPEV